MEKNEIKEYGEGIPFVVEISEETKLKIMFKETGMMDCEGCVFKSLKVECWDIPCVSSEREDGLTGVFVKVEE